MESLHNHTTLSDGKMSHADFLAAAKKHGLSAVAFTDHEALPSEAILRSIRGMNNGYPRWITGIEISSGLPRELGGVVDSGFHIIGLFVNCRDKALLEHCVTSQAARVARMREIVKNLRRAGFTISEGDCLRASGGETVGRPHMVDALNMHAENEAVIENMRLRMKRDSEHDEKLERSYRAMIEKGRRQYPYTLFLGDRSYIDDIYVPYKFLSGMDETVGLIRGAGGLAFIAHCSSVKKKISRPLFEKIFSEKRMDGIEVAFGLKSYGTCEQGEIEEDRAFARDLVKKYDCLASGGADAHIEEDLACFSQTPWISDETSGMLERMEKKTRRC